MESQSISAHVGGRIKMYRKNRHMTIDTLASMINKSRATISKYESGSISVDVGTLLDIAKALDLEVAQLVDYQWRSGGSVQLQESPFPGHSKLFLYFYDGRIKKIVKSVMQLKQDPVSRSFSASLYLDVVSVASPEKCRCIYQGEMHSFDTVVNFNLVNQSNRMERTSINVYKSFDHRTYLWGMLLGISNLHFSPVAVKVLFCQDPLSDGCPLESHLTLSKEDFKLMKQINMFSLDKQADF